MKPMTLVKAADGTTNLHIWREGEEYLLQKGHSFLKQWNSLIFAARPGPPLANTRYVDLSTESLGFADETFDAVYSYHVFEHLTPLHGKHCTGEIFRVLKSGGIVRVSVPDLETACRDYLDTLRVASEHSTQQNLVRYRWAVMAIFEQMVRDRSGGLMLDAIEQGEYDDEQLRHLFGDALRPVVAGRGSARPVERGRAYILLRRIYRAARTILGKSRPKITNRLDPRLTKEAVQWMYDRLSLRLLLEQASFQDIRQMDHASSRIRGWSGYDFDRSNNGDYPLDPSVYMEGKKPERSPRAR